MQPRFLCPHHKQWLFAHPHNAKSHMQDAMETAVYHRERNYWSEALAYQGCAFETAEILLTAGTDCDIEAITALTANAILLSENYQALGEYKMSIDILRTAQQRLLAESALHLDKGTTQHCLQDCISALALGARFKQDRQSLRSGAH